MSYHSNCNVIECRYHIRNKLNITSRVLTFLSSSFSEAPFEVGTLSRVIKVYQEMYKNSHVLPSIAMYSHVMPCIAM